MEGLKQEGQETVLRLSEGMDVSGKEKWDREEGR
jgi:hypothetical protein